jgi:precorrin-6A/cobalt-precorrin-6A reductase
VFVALGRKELAPFVHAPQHRYLIRSVEPVDPPLAVPHATYVLGRGPFGETDDRALLMTHGVEILVSKNSGGSATYGKIAAARMLGLPVIMLRRPKLAVAATASVETLDDAVAWLDHAFAH